MVAALPQPLAREDGPGLSEAPGGHCGPRVRRRPPRVLVVDSDAEAQSALAAGLVAAGLEVLLVAGFQSAMEALAPEAGRPGLVLSEVELPDGDGFSLCGQIRAEARTAKLPVMLLARRPEDFHRDLAGGVGADDYLERPVPVEDVVALARLQVGGRTGDATFESHTEVLRLPDVARALLSGVRSGRVALAEGAGWFAFRHGLVVDAVFHGERGSLAFRRMLGFGAGAFAVTLGPELHKGSFTMDRAYLRDTVLPGLARFDALRERGLPLASRLTVDFARLARELPSLPEDVGEVVRLFDGRRTLRAVLLECRYPEAVAYEAATRLFSLGVLVPACLVEERERVRGGVAVPGFFEPSPSVAPVAPARLEVFVPTEPGYTLEAAPLRPPPRPLTLVEVSSSAPLVLAFPGPSTRAPRTADEDPDEREG
ncbi:response regulator [Myxococcus sp. K15C18031901]|uniref:response regulator n=1 Tax=Myxococcus dinghuensis TaxID=2906761 RepID=UPI0020A7648D|nr:response regulator [Myxococcus dinghuensis]MCP3104437.1 response regulator [Myxococcus dinghuensis]